MTARDRRRVKAVTDNSLPICEAIVYVRDEHLDKTLATHYGHDCTLWTTKTTDEFIQETIQAGGVWGPTGTTWYPYHQVVKVEFKTSYVEKYRKVSDG